VRTHRFHNLQLPEVDMGCRPPGRTHVVHHVRTELPIAQATTLIKVSPLSDLIHISRPGQLYIWGSCAGVTGCIISVWTIGVVKVQKLQLVGSRPSASWDCGFEFHRLHGCSSLVHVVCCAGRGVSDGLFPRPGMS